MAIFGGQTCSLWLRKREALYVILHRLFLSGSLCARETGRRGEKSGTSLYSLPAEGARPTESERVLVHTSQKL